MLICPKCGDWSKIGIWGKWAKCFKCGNFWRRRENNNGKG